MGHDDLEDDRAWGAGRVYHLPGAPGRPAQAADQDDPEKWCTNVDTGLIYGIDAEGGRVKLVMTMTTPACPITGCLTAEVETALSKRLPGVQAVEVEVVWDPPWDPLMMSEAARDRLGVDRVSILGQHAESKGAWA